MNLSAAELSGGLDSPTSAGAAGGASSRRGSGLPRYCVLDATEVEVEARCLEGIADVDCLAAKGSDDVPLDKVADCEAIGVWHSVWLDEELLRRFRSCKVIVRMGVGYDNVDIKAAARLGIPVCNIPDYGTEEVADSAMAMILGLYRKTLVLSHRMAEGVAIKGPDAIAAAAGGAVRVRGTTLGLLGLGRIGTAVAVRANAHGFRVVFYDPHVKDGQDKALGIERADTLEELLRQSRCLSLHCDNNATTEGLIDDAALSQLPHGAFLVNTARGELVVEDALARALKSGRVGAAALDVHATEPFTMGNARASGALATAPNLVCTPHSAWYSIESRQEMREKGAATVALALDRSRTLRNVVNADEIEEYKREAATRQAVEDALAGRTRGRGGGGSSSKSPPPMPSSEAKGDDEGDEHHHHHHKHHHTTSKDDKKEKHRHHHKDADKEGE